MNRTCFYTVSIHNTFGETCGVSASSIDHLICNLAENYASSIFKSFDTFEDMREYLKPSSIYFMQIYYVELGPLSNKSYDRRRPPPCIVRKLKDEIIGTKFHIDELNKDFFFEKYNYWLQVYETELYSCGGLPYWCDNFATMERLISINFPLPFDYMKLDKETASSNYSESRSGDFVSEYALFLEKRRRIKVI